MQLAGLQRLLLHDLCELLGNRVRAAVLHLPPRLDPRERRVTR
jgi:hypothetical protein